MSGASWCVKFLLKALLFYTIAVQDAAPTDVGAADPYQSLSQNRGLFNSSDNVVVLNATNFKSLVYGSEHGWIVEFYNSWCGFCQRFAPTWKALADNILTWRDIVTVAAIDCVDEENNPLCRDFEIMRYPEVRYFAPHENPKSLGTDVEKGKDMDALRQNLIQRLEKEQQEGRGTKWPNITPFRSSEIKNVWDGVADSVKYFFFLFEDAKSFLGSEIILDFHNVTTLQIRRVTSDNNMLCLMHKVTRFPSLVVYGRDNNQNRLNIRVPTRESTRNVIKEFMSLKGFDIDVRDVPDEHPGEWLKAEIPPQPDRVPKLIPEIKPDNPSKIIIPGADVVHQADLEAALRFSLTHEIPRMKIIEGERMKALKNYLTALGSYFPMKRGNPMFLNSLSFIIRSKEQISGADFAQLVKNTEEEMAPVYSEKNEWIGCKGSQPGFRGYPCGLWKVFHTLTVNFAAKSEEYPNMEPGQILNAMHGYIKNFFGCFDCAQHFIAMAEKNKMSEVKTADESVLWLWDAHNEVNQRLKLDSTADPEHPKIQYPSASDCRSCRTENDNWNKDEVLNFLKKQYSYSGIHYDSSTRSPTQRNENKPRNAQERLHFDRENVTTRKFGWDFTIFDISICVVLYVTSAAILILVCIKFAVKRSFKKKVYVHTLDGRV